MDVEATTFSILIFAKASSSAERPSAALYKAQSRPGFK
jgi:hypothetical protein